MKVFQYCLIVIALTACLESSGLSQNQCVDFDTAQTPLNKRYMRPRLTVLNLPPVQISTSNFLHLSGRTTFVSAIIERVTRFGTERVLRLNNASIAVKNLTSIQRPNVVSFDFLDLGGIENFAVNGSTVNVIDISSLPSLINNIQVSVTTNTVSGGKVGRVELKGSIREFSIGGQEFWIDNICHQLSN